VDHAGCTIPVDAITSTRSPSVAIPSSACALRRLPPDDPAQGALDLHAEELELTRRQAESFRVSHHTAAVEQHQDAVLSVQQLVHLFVDPLSIAATGLSKRHDLSSLLGNIPAPSARDRRNVSSLDRGPNIAAASLQSAGASA
jgi:hypothetical protein